ncbi:hypothetical protein BDR03DRAFT_697334 [Suillus americanus]|nr:hypothetical protein BDR03DRAFT_697334 [Suillus americanus]
MSQQWCRLSSLLLKFLLLNSLAYYNCSYLENFANFMLRSAVRTGSNSNPTIVNPFEVVRPRVHPTFVNLTEVRFSVLDYFEKTGRN